MENNIVLIHAALAVLLFLFLLFSWIYTAIRGLIRKENKKRRLKKWFTIIIKSLLVLLFISGLYPLIVLGKVELYHVLKLFILLFIWWFLFKAERLGATVSKGVAILGLFLAGYSSFIDAPKLPKQKLVLESPVDGVVESDLIKGKRIYGALCVQCHGEDGKLGKFQASDLTMSRYSLEEKITFITTGSPLTVMASYENLLSPEEIKFVATYVHSLASE